MAKAVGVIVARRMIPKVLLADRRTRAHLVMQQGMPVNRAGAAIIVAVWVLMAAAAGWLVVGLIGGQRSAAPAARVVPGGRGHDDIVPVHGSERGGGLSTDRERDVALNDVAAPVVEARFGADVDHSLPGEDTWAVFGRWSLYREDLNAFEEEVRIQLVSCVIEHPEGAARTDLHHPEPGARHVPEVLLHRERPGKAFPFTVARDRIDLPFPGDVVDTVGAQFRDRKSPVPKSAGSVYRTRVSINSLTSREISIAYPGLGQDTTRKAFDATVNRSFRNPDEERLIRIAEETYPPTEAVLAIAKSVSGSEALSKERRLWWYDTFDGVRIPYAVTMDAVRYYLGLTQALGRGDSTQTAGIRMKRSHFSYYARISNRTATYSRDGRVFKDVYVVEMGLKWSNYCGSLCACSFRLDRTVLIRPDGTVLCVFGDQKPMVTVS